MRKITIFYRNSDDKAKKDLAFAKPFNSINLT